MNRFTWPLNDSQFTLKDRAKIAAFFLSSRNRWTQGERVKEFERAMAKYMGVKYAVYVSSGSTANTLLAMHLRDSKPRAHEVVLPAVTWQTSCSPWIREGFTPHFIDVSLDDFSMDLEGLEWYLKNRKHYVACVFITSLLGFVPDIARLQYIQKEYGVRIMMDNCENTLGEYYDNKTGEYQNVSHFFTSTTSTYFGHQLQSIEGGFIFTNSEDEYKYFVMGRNHGMTRSLQDLAFPVETSNTHFNNPDVDSRFDFNFLGNNFRNTDVNAFIGLLDLKRARHYRNMRIELYHRFKDSLDANRFHIPPHAWYKFDVPFCLPIICKDHQSAIRKKVALDLCKQLGIETRPIISGNLLRQRAYKSFGKVTDYPDAEYLHNNGFYVGLYANVKPAQIEELTAELNQI
jgi:CDP-6-deoxy-D-xylo-4-hexulose-3-dehydrase